MRKKCKTRHGHLLHRMELWTKLVRALAEALQGVAAVLRQVALCIIMPLLLQSEGEGEGGFRQLTPEPQTKGYQVAALLERHRLELTL